MNLSHIRFHPNRASYFLNLMPDRVPHHPGTEPGIFELLDQGLNRLFWLQKHVQHGRL